VACSKPRRHGQLEHIRRTARSALGQLSALLSAALQRAVVTTANSSLIQCDPGFMGGVAVFVGSRLPVATLLACVNAGNSWERIVASWPWLTSAHLDAAREWAAAGIAGSSGAVPKASASQVHDAPHRPPERPRVLYLGISGTLHPSASTYELVHGRSPWSDGHAKYEAVPWLAQALDGWPDVRIVLTSTLPWKYGLSAVQAQLGPVLSARVIGHTYEDLTTKIVRRVSTRSGTHREIRCSAEDYWRMNKSQIVAAHVDWLKPRAWVAVDDEDILWASNVREHVVIVDGCEGLAHPVQQDKLVTALELNFQR
jgi:uncharacterized protein (DUF433 family)